MTETIKKSASVINANEKYRQFFYRLPGTGYNESALLNAEEEMAGLYYSIGSLLSGVENKMIQFIGSHMGEGTTTLVREFARVCAVTFGRAVLLLDAASSEPPKNLTVTDQEENLLSFIKNGIPMEKPFGEDSGYRLSVCTTSNLKIALPVLFSSSHIGRFIDNLKQQFDLILVDSSPMSLSPDAVAIASKVDGVILVVEAEKTRWPVVESVKETLIKAGGNILGVILNKQRYYIPSFIYKRL